MRTRNAPLKGLMKASPLKNPDNVDTTFADKVYSKNKVDENLNKSGHHTEGDLRGKKKSKHHDTGQGNRMGANMI